MAITNESGTITYTPMPNKPRSDTTGVFDDSHFAICDENDAVKQIKFNATPQSAGVSTTVEAGAAASNVTLTLPDFDTTLAGTTTEDGVGTKNGATVTVSEEGNGALHKTTITLTSTPVAITSTSTANGFGGVKLYDFPTGYIHLHGCTSTLSITVDAAEQANFTDDTPEGDIGLGTVIIANADAMGTDATDDDIATAEAFTMASYTDSEVKNAPEASANFDGRSTAKDLNLNVLVDAADIDDDATTEVEVSGTITLLWSNLGT